MNKNAVELGMKRTNYATVHGLSNSKSVSTARDLGLLCCTAMKDKLFCQLVNCQSYKCMISKNLILQREIVWENTNKMLQQGYNGIKTGVTDSAGPCLATSRIMQTKNQQDV